MNSVTARYLTPSLSAYDLLGGKLILSATPVSPLDWVSVIRHGLPSSSVDSLTKITHMSQSELSTALGIPERTLARHKREGKLNSEESAKLVRLARVIERSVEVFEDFDAAIDWLKSSNTSLAGVTPLGLLDTDIGTESVMDTLGRIEHGIFA